MRRDRRLDVAIGLAVLVAASWWGAYYIRASMAAGRSIGFYHELFEPAVMMACGRGFHTAVRPSEAMTRFLSQAADSFSCASLPPDLALQRGLLPQGSWLYLMLVVAAAWKVLGLSWSGLPPLFGLWFGATSACAYALFRFGMGRAAAMLCTACLSVSSLQVLNLSNFRDYAKAPLMLTLIAIVMLLVLGALDRRRVVALSAAFGAVVGLGYGLKPDTLIMLPLLAGTVLLFLPVPLARELPLKLLAIAAGIGACALAMWPVIRQTPATGNNLWHIAIIGIMPEYGISLGVEHPTYHFGVTGSDEFVELAVADYGKRIHPDWPPMSLSTAEYERGTRTYFAEFLPRFPADMITRTISSIVHIPELPFGWPNPPLPGVLDRVYAWRARLLAPLYGVNLAVMAAVIGGVALARPRIGLFLLFAAVYVGAYPVIQYQNRNFFHLEAIGWLAIGFGLTRIARAVRSRSIGVDVPWPVVRRRALRAAAVALALLAALAGLRAVQQRQVRRMISAYLRASYEPLPLTFVQDGPAQLVSSPELTSADPAWARYLRIAVRGRACAPGVVTFRYDRLSPNRGLAQRAVLPRPPADGDDTVILFEPVYAGFSAIEIVGASGPCLISIGNVTGLQSDPIWIPLVIDANWRDQPLYQRIMTRENIH